MYLQRRAGYVPGDGANSPIGNEAPNSINMTISAFIAIAWFSSLEMQFRIWHFFKVKRGLYFYALLFASWAAFVYPLGSLLQYYGLCSNRYFNVTLTWVGWMTLVTGESLVLYARLHLVMPSRRTLRLVLCMIIADVFIFHVPTVVVHYGANSPDADHYLPIYAILERVEVVGFTVQEFIISSLYLYYTFKMLKPGEAFRKTNTRAVLVRLIWTFIFVVGLDIGVIILEFVGQFELQTTYKAAIYAFKLRLEFHVLNSLMEILGRKQPRKFTPNQFDDGRHEKGDTDTEAGRPINNDNNKSSDVPSTDTNCWSVNTLNANRHVRIPIGSTHGIPGLSGGSSEKPLPRDPRSEWHDGIEADNSGGGQIGISTDTTVTSQTKPHAITKGNVSDPYALPLQRPGGYAKSSSEDGTPDKEKDLFFERVDA